jgi:GTPase SAR1 family protein
VSAPAPGGREDAAPRALKLCFVGDPGVGKSSVVQRLAHDRFPPLPSGPGIVLHRHRMRSPQGSEIALTLWDVAAASAIDTLSQAFLSGVDAAVGVAVAGDPDSIRRAQDLLDQVRRLHPRAATMLLLNKCDLAAGAALPEGIAAATVSARAGQGLNDAIGALLERIG